MHTYKVFIVLLIAIITIQCSDDEASFLPPDIPIPQLQASPETIIVEGRRLYLATYLWRDFQPISPPGGKPLIAFVYVTTIDSIQLPGSISTDAIWIVYNNQVWKSWFTNEYISPEDLKPYYIIKIAREGPKWGPHVYVDVIVRVFDGQGKSQLLRAPDQWIHRTD